MSAASSTSFDISYRRIVAIAIPVIFANLAIPMQSVIDTAIVGNMPEAAKLAGMGLAIQLFSLALVSFNFLQYASSGLSAQALGRQQDTHDIDPAPLLSILQRALVLALAIGAILLVLKPWIIDIGLQLLSANTASGAAAQTYLDVRFLSVTAELMNYAFLGWFAGQGKTRYMLYQQSFIALINVLATLFFVYVMDMGLAGVALGTVLAFWLGIGLALWLSQRHLSVHWRTLLTPNSTYFTRDKMLRLFSLNKDIFIRTLILTVSFAWITRLSAQSGDLVLAANAILLQVLSISAFALDGVAVSAETLSGQAYGRRNWRQFYQVVARTGLVSYVLAAALSLLWWLLMPYYLDAMTDITEVRALAKQYQHYAVLLPLVGVGAYWLDGIFFGLTAGRLIRYAAIILAVLFFPLSFWLYQQFSVAGIWLSVWALLLLRLLILAVFLWVKRHTDGTSSEAVAS